MNNNELNKGIESLKKIQMSSKEKELMYNSIMTAFPAEIAKNASVKSPWTVYSFNMWITRHRWSYAVILLLVVSLAGGTVVSAASGSVPGDVLYPIKVNVSEPVRVAFAGSAKAKAELAIDFADERMKEGEILASEGKLDEVKQKELSDRVIAHTETLNTALLEVASSSDPINQNDSDDIRDNFTKRMSKHADRLDEIAQKDNEEKVQVHVMKVREIKPQSAMMSVPVATPASDSEGDSDTNVSVTIVNPSSKKMRNREDNPIFKLADSARASRDEVGNRGHKGGDRSDERGSRD